VALKPTIYKFRISLSDLNRHYYDTLNLTVAQHPSETVERMMVRVLVYCINADNDLQFTKGLSDIDQPDLWLKRLDDSIQMWIEVGEPDPDRIKKACGRSDLVKVYSFNSKSAVWWKQQHSKMLRLTAECFQIEWQEIVALAALVERNMECSITISDESAYVGAKLGECNVTWKRLE
jgi:uncharacterized protein YaeQ